MEHQNEQETFSYTYSAKQQEEVERIRRKYQPLEEDKMTQLRRLDAGVTKKGTITALVVGIFGTLVMGMGMSLIMTDLGEILGLTNVLVPGVIIGLAGMLLAALAYPLYARITKKEREKVAPEILRLTDELMK